ncbi:WXG100 family type VII secretion target [Kitasatospora sp. NPDC004614]|uniref:WXG100 family type VII secretion target n=1 Tax=unclassified Kitasatospora TaxID=2633591 RepID=UPI0036CBDD33
MASHKTPFDSYALIPLKDMVGHSSPDRIREVGDHWKNVHQELNDVAAKLQEAVQHASANWEGAAAQGFAQKGGQIQQSLTNTAAHASNTSVAMDYAATALQQTKSTMGQIKVPSLWDRAVKTVNDGFASSDEGLKRDLASGMNRIDAVNKNAHELSATEVAHQYAIGVMEHLGPQYLEAASYLDNPPASVGDGGTREAYPPPPQVSPPPGHTPPSSPMPKYPEGHPKDLPPPGYVPPGDPRAPMPGIPNQPNPLPPGHGGMVPPPGQPWTPPAGTGLDGWTPPDTGVGGGGHPGGGLPGGVGTLPGPGTGGGGSGGGGIGGGGVYLPGGGGLPGGGSGGGGRGGGGLPGGGGRGGGLPTGGLGTGGAGGGKVGGSAGAGAGAGGKAGGVGGAGAGGAGAAGGRGAAGAGGMGGGMHGGGMGGAGGAKGGAGAKGGSGLVRKAGGTIGGAKAGGAGGRAFTEGGSGIGKGRGAGQGGAAGMHGAPGSGSANRKKKNEGHRPDYLVEDEETWRGGTANPGVIE